MKIYPYMKKILLALAWTTSLISCADAAPADAVTQADLKALIERINRLEAENKAQAKRIAELEGRVLSDKAATGAVLPNEAATNEMEIAKDEDTQVGESGRIWTTGNGKKFLLADSTANLFQPLTAQGLTFTPYGYITFEAIHNTHKTDVDSYTDWLRPRGNGGKNGDHQTVFSMNDSILGFNVGSAELQNGWKFGGKFEFDLAGDDADHPDFHFRHLYFDMENKDGWSFLFGQTWHIWKMVAPQEIDGAWLEQTGYPFRRSPQARVTKRWEFEDGGAIEARVGLVKNGNGMGGDRDGDANQDNTGSAWCLVEGALLYDRRTFWEDTDRRWLVGVGGMYGRDKSHRVFMDEDGGFERYGKSDEYDSDMVMVAGKLPFLEKFTLTGQLFAGENLGGVQAGIGQTVAITDPTRKGREVSTVGGFADLRFDLNDMWAFAVGYGADDPTDREAKHAADRIYNGRAYADVFYQFNANIRFALEYARLQTKYYAQDDADDDRIQFSAYLDF